MYVPVPVTLMGRGGGGLQSVLETGMPAAPPVPVVPAPPPATPAVVCPAAPAVVCPAAPAVVCPAAPDALSPAAPALVLPAEPTEPAAPAEVVKGCPGFELFKHASRDSPNDNKARAVTRRQRSNDMSPPAQN